MKKMENDGHRRVRENLQWTLKKFQVFYLSENRTFRDAGF
jgi:hypothetical protein